MLRQDELKIKISRAKEMLGVVRTMKTLAVVNVKLYEQAIESLSVFGESIEIGLQIVLSPMTSSLHLPSRKKNLITAVLVFGSEMGLSGRFNEQISSFTLQQLKRNNIIPHFLAVAGDKVYSILEESGFHINDRVAFPSSPAILGKRINELLLKIESWHDIADVESIIVFHNTPSSGTSYQPQMVYVVPLEPQWLRDLQLRRWPSRAIPMCMADSELLLSHLIRNHIYSVLSRAVVDSLVSENINRLSSMQVAEKNIHDHIDALVMLYNHQRQEAITAELLDIVSGSEAVS